MRNNDILNFIAPCLNGELSEALSGGEILRITFDDGALSLSASVKFDRLIADRLILDAQKAVREYFGIRKVTLSPVYTGLELSQDCAPMLIRAVKENIAAANGFLDSAKFGFADGSVSLTVPDGAQLLIDAKTPEFLERFISETFDKRVKVCINSGKTAVTIDSPEYVEMQSKNVNIEIPKEAPPERKKPKQEYDDLPISLTNAKVIFGSRIKSKPVALKGVSIEDGNVTVWGSVFALQIRDTRDGKRKIITFNITDKTNSFTVKIFEMSQNCETLVKNISDGACVMLRGHVEYDDYIKSYCIKANSVMLIDRIEVGDDALEKRVELHMHTNMSAMDGMTPASAAAVFTGQGRGFAPCTAQAVLELKHADLGITTIGTRHGEKLFEVLVTAEEMLRAEDLPGFFRIPADNRNLNYDNYFSKGNPELGRIGAYTSHNTSRLCVEEMKQLLLKLRLFGGSC